MLWDRLGRLDADGEPVPSPTYELGTSVMPQVSATRSELLARRARIRLAGQGRDLLKERRTALVREFHRLGASVLESLDALDRDAAEAGRWLGITLAAGGPAQVESA